MIDRELLARAAAPFGVTVDAALFERFDIYARLLVEWNEKMNLTAITDPTDMAVKHFADSLTAAHLLPDGAFSLIDVGTGAGFPGVPLAMVRDDCALTLLDSLNKRLVFLEALCDAVGVKAVRVHARRGRRQRSRAAGKIRRCDRPCGEQFACAQRILPALCAGGRTLFGAQGRRGGA